MQLPVSVLRQLARGVQIVATTMSERASWCRAMTGHDLDEEERARHQQREDKGRRKKRKRKEGILHAEWCGYGLLLGESWYREKAFSLRSVELSLLLYVLS